MVPRKGVSVNDEVLIDLIDRFSRLTLSADLSSVTPSKNDAKTKCFKKERRKHLSKTTGVPEKEHEGGGDRTLFKFLKDCTLNDVPKAEQKLCKSAGDADPKKETFSRIQKPSGTKYYAVAIPEGTERATGDLSDGPLVYTNIKDALQAIKVYKGSRCREFTDKNEALNYALKMLEKQEKKKASEDDGPKSATAQELCQLRKYIEKGEEDIVAKTIWKNPKMLIGRSDTPSILQEGSRYNAFHVAAKCNRPTIIQLIMDVLADAKVAAALFPMDPLCMRVKRMNHIIDLYLNTPDKKLGDTPLHFASKFGCLESTKVLLSHAACDQYIKNNEGLMPHEIICFRNPSAPLTVQKSLKKVFKGMAYITILRSEKNDVPAIIGKPVSAKCLGLRSINECGNTPKPKDPAYSIKAFAGPMSPKVAQKFYQLLKHSFSPQQKEMSPAEQKVIAQIRFTDSEKGVERIGRRLAEEMKVDWEEYFPVLNCFTNFASADGLKLLESYIKKKLSSESFNYHKSPQEPEQKFISMARQYPSHVNPLSHDLNLYLNEEEKNVNCDFKNCVNGDTNKNVRNTLFEGNKDNCVNKIDIGNHQVNGDEGIKEYFTPPSSPVGSEYFITPPTSPPPSPLSNQNSIYLEGSSLTRLDIDVFLAIGNFEVNSQLFPNVYRWKKFLETRLQSLENDSSQKDIFTPLSSLPVPRNSQNEKDTLRRKLF